MSVCVRLSANTGVVLAMCCVFYVECMMMWGLGRSAQHMNSALCNAPEWDPSICKRCQVSTQARRVGIMPS